MQDRVFTSPEELIAYSRDATQHRSLPDAVLMPISEEEVIKIVRKSYESEIPIVPRGAGTSLSGGPVPVKGGIVVDFTLMNKIKLDLKNSLVSLQPGVIYDDLNKTLEKHGFFFPPDPGSGKVCTIGGMVATNSSGLRAVKYGTTKDYVLGLKVVMPPGKLVKFGKKSMKSSSGYNMIGLFVGSEGTLGIFTEITLKVIKKPTHFATRLASFDSVEDAGNAARKIISKGLEPAVLEFMDASTLEAIKKFRGWPFPKAEAILLLEMDGFSQEVMLRLEKAIEICKVKGKVTRAREKEEREKIWDSRKSALPALARYKPILILEDVTVPISNLSSMMKIINKISKEYEIEIATFGHVGDGNLHPTFLLERKDLENAERAKKELFEKALKLKGTLSGEHGIGIEKRQFMSLERDSLGLMKKIKKMIDPKGLMNPGKIF
jgi:glycolate oxidase